MTLRASRIVHAALPEDWAAALAEGAYSVSSRGRTLGEEGFIHASSAAQLDGVLRTFYADIDEIVLLVLDVDALARAGSEVRWERVPDASEPFPHVFGPIPSSVVGQGNPVIAAMHVERGPGSPWHVAAGNPD